MRKVYTSSDEQVVINAIVKLLDAESTDKISEADIVVFPDEDRELHPAFYKGKMLKGYSTDLEADARLVREYNAAHSDWKPILAFGSGAIFCSAMMGAQIIGKVSGHTFSHKIRTVNSQWHDTIGTHTQMMNPYTLEDQDYSLMAYSLQEGGSDISFDDNRNGKGIEFYEPEIVYYNFFGSLCVQTPVYRMGQTRPYYLMVKSFANHLLSQTGYKYFRENELNPYTKK